MKRRFEDAIGQVGCIARLPGENGAEFPVSIQPMGTSGEARDKTGAGYLKNLKLYTVCNDITAQIKDGGAIECNNVRYYVKSIETMNFRGKEVYRRGILLREEEGGY